MGTSRRSLAFALTGLCAVVGLASGRAAEPTASEVAQALQRKYDTVKDFSTDFVHTYQGGVLKKQLTERGHLLVKKPGKMRWDYSAPEEKQFVSDGLKLYVYVPADKQVIVTAIAQTDEAATPALFLAGKGNLTRDFTPSLINMPAGLPVGSLALKLLPRSRQPDYEWLILAVDPATLTIRGLVTADTQAGTSTFAFTNLKENIGLADREFTLESLEASTWSPMHRVGSRRVFAVSMIRRLATVGALSIALSACATSAALHRGREAEQRQDYDSAVVAYSQALKLEPQSTDARTSLERSRLRAAQDHFVKGRRFAALGKYDEALVEFGLAAELNPTDADTDQELRLIRTKLRTKLAVSAESRTSLETLVDRARHAPTPGLDLPRDTKLPATLTFREASSRDVFITIARFANLSVVFDSTFREAPVTVDLRNASLEDALSTVSGVTHTFFRVLAPSTFVVVPDTQAKRREYEEDVVRTFYLSNADLKEAMDLLRLVLDLRRVSATTSTNALTVQDTPERIAAAGLVLAAIDKARPEVIIDVELLEVNRTKLLEYGLQIASPGSPGINGSISINPADPAQTLTLQALRSLNPSDVLLANLPSLYYRLLKSDVNTRTLANPQLRTSDGTTAQARFGERVPVPSTTFLPLANGLNGQQPITSYTYENIGVNIDITPRTHHDDDVSLSLKIAVTNMSGTGFGGLPTFGNREINTVIRLRDGETNMLAGLIRDDERQSVDGIPGLSDLPMLGHLFTHTTRTNEQTDIVLTLTPHIIRVLDLTEADLRAIKIGRDTPSTPDGPSAGLIELPTAQPPQPGSNPAANPPPAVGPTTPPRPAGP